MSHDRRRRSLVNEQQFIKINKNFKRVRKKKKKIKNSMRRGDFQEISMEIGFYSMLICILRNFGYFYFFLLGIS